MHRKTACTNPQAPCDRRTFLAGMACTGASFLLGSPTANLSAQSTAQPSLLCVGSYGPADSGTLHLLQPTQRGWEQIGTSSSARPLSIVRHPRKPLVYVANGVRSHAHEPRGTVEAFLIDARQPRIELVARRPLSLSATEPVSIDVSPDGGHLMVAAFGGGAYNLLPLDSSGAPGNPAVILKQVGRGPVSSRQSRAHPAAVLFHPAMPWVVAADFGADRLDLISLEPTKEQDLQAHVTDRTPCAPGSGPSGVALHRDGSIVIVRHGLQPMLSSYRLTTTGRFAAPVETALGSPATALAFHPQRDLLYSTECVDAERSRLKTWQLCSGSGALQKSADLMLHHGEISAMLASAETLWLAAESGIVGVRLDAQTGLPADCRMAATVPGSKCLTAVSPSAS
jgi:6-phosphogluconolactonase (cycloisomerase 2 family)